MSLGLRDALTKKVWESAVQGLGNEAGAKRGKKRKGKRKGRERQKTVGKGEGKKRAQSPIRFSYTLFMDASLEGLHESEAE